MSAVFTNISEIFSSAIKLRLIFVANSVAAGKHRQATGVFFA